MIITATDFQIMQSYIYAYLVLAAYIPNDTSIFLSNKTHQAMRATSIMLQRKFTNEKIETDQQFDEIGEELGALISNEFLDSSMDAVMMRQTLLTVHDLCDILLTNVYLKDQKDSKNSPCLQSPRPKIDEKGCNKVDICKIPLGLAYQASIVDRFASNKNSLWYIFKNIPMSHLERYFLDHWFKVEVKSGFKAIKDARRCPRKKWIELVRGPIKSALERAADEANKAAVDFDEDLPPSASHSSNYILRNRPRQVVSFLSTLHREFASFPRNISIIFPLPNSIVYEGAYKVDHLSYFDDFIASIIRFLLDNEHDSGSPKADELDDVLLAIREGRLNLWRCGQVCSSCGAVCTKSFDHTATDEPTHEFCHHVNHRE